MVQCLVLVSALLLASVWVPVDSRSGMYKYKHRQRRSVSNGFYGLLYNSMGYICAPLLCTHTHTHTVSRVRKKQAPDHLQEHHSVIPLKHNCNTIL